MTTDVRSCPVMRLMLLALLCVALAARAEEWRWENVPRIVAIGDVHGAYHAMVHTLERAGILDEAGSWTGGQAHLVVTGDVLDRGPQSRAAMDLLMRLEPEAEAAGGQVHVLLGNHEVMNLVGDLRYVSAAEYAAFADEESAADRDRWYAAAAARNPGLTRAAFDKAVPAGYFAQRRAFAPDGKYGAWLLGKPIVIVIDGTAFVHGGLSPEVAQAGLDGINGTLRGELEDYVEQLHAVIEAGYLLPTDGFYQQADRLAALPADPARQPAVQAAIDTLVRLHDAGIHDVDSPVWYRGNVACSPLLETYRLESALESIGARRVVIGHTPTPTREVLERLDGRVIEIDTGMLHGYFGGSGHALIIEGDRLSVVSENGAGPTAPAPHPRRVDLPANGMLVKQLESWLATGDIVERTEDDDHTVVTLARGGERIDATFVPNPRTRGVVPELAAYRLDRLLGLGMVPATVARTIDGKRGVLQLVPDSNIDEARRAELKEGASAWCPLALQWQGMYGFDALAYNPARLPETVLYGRNDWQLMLVGNEGAFAPRTGRPPYLRNVDLELGGAWARALSGLSNDVLKAKLGDVLDSRRLLALYERRDDLLDEARKQAAE